MGLKFFRPWERRESSEVLINQNQIIIIEPKNLLSSLQSHQIENSQ